MRHDDEDFPQSDRTCCYRRATGNAPFGSLLVDPNGTVLREDHNTVLSDGDDITAHPELKLARWAARELRAKMADGEIRVFTPFLSM